MRTGMDPLDFEDKHRARKASGPKDTETASLFDEPLQPKREPVPVVPSQSSSVTSNEAAEKIAPVFSGNKSTCLKAIIYSEGRGGTTRKQLAADYFQLQQQYVTGPIAVLIDEGFVYEEPLRVNGEIQRRGDGTPIPKRIDGSAVLLPTNKAKERANAAA